MLPTRSRLAFAIVAIIAWAGELSFVYANAVRLGSLGAGLWWAAAFLTDWVGTLVAVVCTAAALGHTRLATPAWLGLATVATVLGGTMFAALGGWAAFDPRSLQTVLGFSSFLAHIVLPWSMLLVWLLAAPHGGLRRLDAPRFLIFALIYLIQMFLRGALTGRYPYPEVDVLAVGYAPALTFAGGVLVLYALVGAAVIGIDRRLARRR